jgi:hypothetical protein
MTNQVNTVKQTRILDTPVFRRGDTVPLGIVTALDAATALRRDLETTAYKQAIFLVIQDFVERVLFVEKLSAVIGRADMKTGFLPDIDLTRHGALVHGISRAHARLHRQGAHFYITDLCSDNGTFIGGKRLTPDVPNLLGSGDELVLGCLKMKVLHSH